MKLGLTLLLVSLVVILGCNAPDSSKDSVVEEPTQEVDATTETTSGYVNGSWISSWNDALHYAEQLNRPILMNFTGSDWCPWCFRLRDEVFVMDAFKNYANENLILLTVDFPRNLQLPQEIVTQNNSLQSRYTVRGYPTIVLVDYEGTELGRTGYQQGGPVAYVAHLKSLIGQR